MERALRTAMFSKGKVLRSLLIWLVFSVVLLAWHHHQQQERRATIQFTVSVEGKERPLCRAALGQRPFDTSEHSGLGQAYITSGEFCNSRLPRESS